METKYSRDFFLFTFSQQKCASLQKKYFFYSASHKIKIILLKKQNSPRKKSSFFHSNNKKKNQDNCFFPPRFLNTSKLSLILILIPVIPTVSVGPVQCIKETKLKVLNKLCVFFFPCRYEWFQLPAHQLFRGDGGVVLR